MNLKLIKMRWTEQRNIGFGGSSWWRLQWFWCVVVMMGVAVVVGAGPVVRGDYTHEWAVHIEGGDDTAAREIARRHGFQVAYKVFDDIYVLRHRRLAKRSADPSPHHHQRLVEDPRVRWAEQQQVKRRNKRDYLSHLTGISYPNARLNDPKWPQMWYLNRGGSLDMNVQAAWAAGATGKDVVVTVLDDGLERDHPDLIKNYDPNASYDVNNHDHDPMPRYDLVDTNRHGTRIAGVVAADANNSICGVGVAYQASIGGIRMLDGDITDAVEARSLALNPQHIDIYSASWGPDDDGNTMEGPGQLATRAFVEGIRDGRGGKGSIFVWASGNGGHNQDNCNCDGYTNSIWTLSISSATERGQVPWYSEACSSTLATTYSSGSFGERQIITTDLHHSCTSSHTGTSASAPLAAGICALALQVNRDITWRDMQHIVVRTARPENLEASDWQINGVGRRVSHRFGYGLMDTYGMVKLARNWTSVPAQRTCDVEAPHIDKLIHQKSFVSMELDVTDCPGVNFLEHVQAKVSLTAARRGNIEIYLSSPAGTRSTLLARRPHDSSRSGFNNWPFMTVHMWGEQPLGKWVLEVHYNGHFFTTDNAGVKSWSLTMYGTESDPGQAVSSLHPHISYTDSSLHQVVDTTEDCTSLQWKCRSGDCINSNKRCDQTKQDCNDNSDEEGCPAGPAECGASQWQCTDKDCIEMKFRCDGLSHCKDGSDEVMCTTTCTPEQIYCGSGLCAADIGYCPPTTTTTTTIPTPVPCSSSQTHCGGGLCAAENIRCPNTTTTTTTTHNITATTTVITPTTTTTTTVISTTTATTPTTTTPTTTNTTTNTIIPTATTARGCGAESVVVWGRHLRLCTGPLRHLLSMLGQCWEGSDEDDYSWAKDYTSCNYYNDEIEINKDTAVDFNNYLREVCAETLLKTQMVIGGPDTTVEIDETHFSKRKYNRGRELPEQWVFGGVCRETKECFLYAVPTGNAETLTQCIKRSIRPGTTIISDLWKAYDGISLLDEYNYKHFTVNHSENFVDPKTGANTQAVESMWHSLKMKKKRQGGIHRQMIDSYLCEFVWRKRIEKDQYF